MNSACDGSRQHLSADAHLSRIRRICLEERLIALPTFHLKKTMHAARIRSARAFFDEDPVSYRISAMDMRSCHRQPPRHGGRALSCRPRRRAAQPAPDRSAAGEQPRSGRAAALAQSNRDCQSSPTRRSLPSFSSTAGGRFRTNPIRARCPRPSSSAVPSPTSSTH
jgi:hypothetical protein